MPYLNKGGSVINIASTDGIDTYHPDSVDYSVSKAGVIMFTKAMARELAPNVRINCIAPGWFDTDINADLPKEYMQRELDKIAIGRFGHPEEIAGVAAFLASDDAKYITGSVIVVDGGHGGAV
jgi:3-oxoacyl-[acyl-carrier protein] reductase